MPIKNYLSTQSRALVNQLVDFGGRSGCMSAPSQSNVFHFHAVFGKILSNNSFSP